MPTARLDSKDSRPKSSSWRPQGEPDRRRDHELRLRLPGARCRTRGPGHHHTDLPRPISRSASGRIFPGLRDLGAGTIPREHRGHAVRGRTGALNLPRLDRRLRSPSPEHPDGHRFRLEMSESYPRHPTSDKVLGDHGSSSRRVGRSGCRIPDRLRPPGGRLPEPLNARDGADSPTRASDGRGGLYNRRATRTNSPTPVRAGTLERGCKNHLRGATRAPGKIVPSTLPAESRFPTPMARTPGLLGGDLLVTEGRGNHPSPAGGQDPPRPAFHRGHRQELEGLALLGDDLRPSEPPEPGRFFSLKRRTPVLNRWTDKVVYTRYDIPIGVLTVGCEGLGAALTPACWGSSAFKSPDSTSVAYLSASTGIDRKQVRTSLDRLATLGFLKYRRDDAVSAPQISVPRTGRLVPKSKGQEEARDRAEPGGGSLLISSNFITRSTSRFPTSSHWLRSSIAFTSSTPPTGWRSSVSAPGSTSRSGPRPASPTPARR